jgi:hypothetical protein
VATTGEATAGEAEPDGPGPAVAAVAALAGVSGAGLTDVVSELSAVVTAPGAAPAFD